MPKRSSPMARSDSLSAALSNDDDLEQILKSIEKSDPSDEIKASDHNNPDAESVNEVHEVLIKDDTIR